MEAPVDRSLAAGASLLGGTVAVIDLSLLISEELPGWWPTHMPFQHKTYSWFADRETEVGRVLGHLGPYSTRWMLMDEHTGTHFDAPAHSVPPPGSGLPGEHPLGALTGDRVALDRLIGAARVMDVRGLLETTGPGISPMITADHVRAWEREAGALRDGEVLLLRSDWDARYLPGTDGTGYAHDVIVTRQAPGWPAPDLDMARYVAERGVRCVGTDAPSIGASHDGQPLHVAGFTAGLVFIECLANLVAIPPEGALFVFAPIKVSGSTGAPGRAFVLVPAAPVEPGRPAGSGSWARGTP